MVVVQASYFVIVTCRNSEKTISKAIMSLFNQSTKPEFIIVVNDGSTDRTQEILNNLKKDNLKIDHLYIINNPNLGYDISRIVKNWNKALRFSKSLKKCDYHMIATDDTVYSSDYAKQILDYLQCNKNTVIISGEYTDNESKSPHGAGRFVLNEFLTNCRWSGLYPEKMGYESAIIHEAHRLGYETKVLHSARFEHVRPLGKDHKFYEFGASMRTLGYYPLYVLGRVIKNLVKNTETGRVGSLRMLKSYLTFKCKKEGYNSRFDKDFRIYISNMQRELILKKFKVF